jgi:hypothetical protein
MTKWYGVSIGLAARKFPILETKYKKIENF